MSATNETTSIAKDQAGAVAQTTKEQAGAVAGNASQAAKDVAGTAKDQAASVAAEAKDRARDLVGETRDQVRTQATTQTQKLATTVRSLATELEGMASSGQNGTATEVARQAANRVNSLAGYLENTQPEHILEDLRYFARRRTGLFMLGAATAGFVTARAVKAASSGSDSSQQAIGYRQQRSYPPSTTSTYSTGYDAPSSYGTTGGYESGSSYPTTTTTSGYESDSSYGSDSTYSLPADSGTGSTVSTHSYGTSTVEPDETTYDPTRSSAGYIQPVDPITDDERGGRR